MLDEPDASLDKEGQIALAVAIRQAAARGCIVVIVTHDEQLRSLADETWRLRDGKLRRDGRTRSGDAVSNVTPMRSGGERRP